MSWPLYFYYKKLKYTTSSAVRSKITTKLTFASCCVRDTTIARITGRVFSLRI